MQTAKGVAASAKESAANTAASAQAGMDKTKAIVQEKAERVTAHDPMQKEMSSERKQEKIRQAECNKQEARENNAAARQAAGTGYSYNAPDHLTGSVPTGYGTGQQTQNLGGVNLKGADAVYPGAPIESGPDTTRNTTGGAPGTGHGTGGTYQ